MRNILTVATVLIFFSNYVFSQRINNNPVWPDKTIFLNFHLKEFNSGNVEVELKEFEVVSYRTKAFNSVEETGKNSILVVLKNEKGQIVSQQSVPSPLNQQVEVPDYNGVIQRVSLTNEEAVFSVRMPYIQSAKMVEVFQRGMNDSINSIASFYLQ